MTDPYVQSYPEPVNPSQYGLPEQPTTQYPPAPTNAAPLETSPAPYTGQAYPSQAPQYPGAGYTTPAPAQNTAYTQVNNMYYGADPAAPFGRDPISGEPLSDKSKVAAGLLQLFLGGFGAGRFYIGSNGVAIAQLIMLIVGWVTVFVVVGVIILAALGIWCLVDAIMMFSGSVRDGRGLKLRS